jgi:hypothetical protein
VLAHTVSWRPAWITPPIRVTNECFLELDWCPISCRHLLKSLPFGMFVPPIVWPFTEGLTYAYGIETREYGRRDPSRWPRGILYPQKLALSWPTSGGHSDGIVRSRTQATEYSFSYFCKLHTTFYRFFKVFYPAWHKTSLKFFVSLRKPHLEWRDEEISKKGYRSDKDVPIHITCLSLHIRGYASKLRRCKGLTWIREGTRF